MKYTQWRGVYGVGCLLGLLTLAGCGGSISADESDELALQERMKETEIIEQVRFDDLQRDDQVWTSARARDIGPLNELVRHRERTATGDDSSSVVDIGPASEIERHRRGGACSTCAKRTF